MYKCHSAESTILKKLPAQTICRLKLTTVKLVPRHPPLVRSSQMERSHSSGQWGQTNLGYHPGLFVQLDAH